MSSFSRFLLGALVGGAAGAVVGLLFAPRSGAETRRMIADEAARCRRESQESLHKAQACVSDTVDKAVGKARETAQHMGQGVRHSAETLREKACQISSELEATGRQTWARLTEKKPGEACEASPTAPEPAGSPA